MLLGLLGDVHGAFDAVGRVMALEDEVPAWLSVGDIAGEGGGYPSPPRPLFFIKGNNEDFDLLARLAAGEQAETNLQFVPNGRLVDVGGARVAGLGGTFAPKWYDTLPADLPAEGGGRKGGGAARGSAHAPRPGRAGQGHRDDKRRHFVRAEVEACAALQGVDIFLSHEAPRPCWVGTGRGRNDAGKAVINEILAATKPRLHFFGHHHRASEAVLHGIPSVGLPLVTDGYVIVETDTWRWTRRGTPGHLPI
jgi:hypothetical protein